MTCVMCLFGDLEEGETCHISDEPITVFKKCWAREPKQMRNERTIVKMEVPKGSYYHVRRGRAPLQGRAGCIKILEFLFPDGNTNEHIHTCGADQKERDNGSTTYTPGEFTYMDIQDAKNRTRSPWYPGIHFHFRWEDIIKRK